MRRLREKHEPIGSGVAQSLAFQTPRFFAGSGSKTAEFKPHELCAGSVLEDKDAQTTVL